jgi:hypothetical protein
MLRNRFASVAAVVLIASLAVVGCKKKEEPVATTPPPAATPAPAPATPPPAPAATASVTGVDLGTAVGADKKVTMPATTFKPKDTIIAAVSTSTSDPAAAVSGKLGAKWSFQDGQVVNEESRDFNLTGSDVTDFQIAKPSGWPTGKYKVEISLDGNVVQSREFEVK